jgi:proline iminopeptidase
VADLDRVLRERTPGERVVLAGSSWGAHLALLYAMEHPERVQALVLSGLVSWRSLFPDSNRAYIAELERRMPKRDSAWHDSVMRDQMERLMRMPRAEREAESRARVRESDSIIADERAEARDQRALKRRLTGCQEVRAQTMASLSPPPPIEQLRRTEVPTLILRGGRRSLNEDGAAAVARLLPHAQVHTLPDAGHDPWFSRPELFFPAVERFLAGHAASGGA